MATFVVELKDEVSANAKKASSAVSDLHSQMGDANETLGGSGGLSDEMGSFGEVAGDGAIAAEAAAAAVVALGAAALYAGGALAVSAGETKEAFLAMASAMTGSKEGGQAVLELVDQLSQSLPIAKDKLEALSKSFMSAGIRTVPALKKALEATAASTALMGDEGAAKFSTLISKVELLGEAGKNLKNLSKALQGTGLDVEDVAAQLGVPAKKLDAMLKSGKITSQQLGDALQDAMLKKGASAIDVANQKLSVMADKAKEAFVGMFDGIVDTPGYKSFIDALNGIGVVLGANAAAGKGALTSMFNVVFGVAAKVITWMMIALLKLGTYGLRAYIWLFPFLKKLKEWWQQHAMTEKFVTTLKVLGAVIGGILLVAIAAVATTLGLMTAGIMLVVQAGIALWTVIVKVATWIYKMATAAWDFVSSAGKAIADWISGAVSAGEDFVKGIVEGIKNGAQWVYDAVANLGSGMVDGLKNVLGISSPSKVMMQLGDHSGQGFALGLTNASNDVAAAGSSMAQSAVGGVASAAPSASSGASITVNVAAGAIVIHGAGGDAKELTREAMAELFEEAALSQGRGASAA